MRKIVNTACLSLHCRIVDTPMSTVPILWIDNSRISWDEELPMWCASLPSVSSSQHRAFDTVLWRDEETFLEETTGKDQRQTYLLCVYMCTCVHVCCTTAYSYMWWLLLSSALWMWRPKVNGCLFVVFFNVFVNPDWLTRLTDLQDPEILFLLPSSEFVTVYYHPDLYRC